MIAIVVISLIVMIILGVPICFAIGLSGFLAIYFGTDLDLFIIVQRLISGVNSFSLMAVPLFILGGAIMDKAGISKRIVGFASSLFSWLRGGLSIVCVAANMIFAGISGSGAAAVSAIGGLTAPAMKEKGYRPGFVAALISGAGSLGPVIPPSVDMIVFASITGLSVGRMFMGGILPGMLIGLCLMVFCHVYARVNGIDYGGKFDLGTVWRSFKDSIWGLIMPFIVIGGVIFGIFTATEAGVIACIYGLIVGAFVYKELKWKDIIPLFKKATENTCQVMMIIGASTIYGYIFSLANVGDTICSFILSLTDSTTMIMLLTAGFMIFVGCFMESLAAMPIILPIVYPLLESMGANMTQFGVMFCLCTVLGGLTPPVGIYLFLSMTIAKAKIQEIIPYLLVVVGIIVAVILTAAFVPGLTSFLPNLLIR
ncbi:TRAP transporter large permease [Bacilliculturomica massiliensis]|uniref:TRAP transporter large permease n=1 Tax=Bacilliculturomica massiliensis TaxID=1917867 RepID=UPI0010304602|nr:TRAP transporter large permease [Bacilliculturomica massiliensis]